MTDDPTPPDALPEDLTERLDGLDLPALVAVREYAEDLLAAERPPMTEDVLEAAEGEVLGVDDRGPYALVRKRPPTEAGGDAPVSLYHVHRERYPDGEEDLHWSFVGEIRDPVVGECPDCGASLEAHADRCHHCGRADPIDGGGEDR